MAGSVLTAMAIGVASELSARLQRLWVYRSPLYPVLNVLLVFGLVMGWVATLADRLGLPGVFGVGFAIGLAWEILNLALLDWWFFPGDRLWRLRGREACALGVSLAWGAVPVSVALLRRLG